MQAQGPPWDWLSIRTRCPVLPGPFEVPWSQGSDSSSSPAKVDSEQPTKPYSPSSHN
jgi:hypothetical protein